MRTVTANTQLLATDDVLYCNGTLSVEVLAATNYGDQKIDIVNIGTGVVTVCSVAGSPVATTYIPAQNDILHLYFTGTSVTIEKEYAETTFQADHIEELTSGHGVDVDGVLLKDNDVNADDIVADNITSTHFITDVTAAKLDISGTTIQAAGTDADVDVNVLPKGNGLVNLSGDWYVNASGALNPATDNSKDIGNGLVNPRDITLSRTFSKKGSAADGYGFISIKSLTATHTLTNAKTNTIAIQIPQGVRLVGVLLRNDTIIAGDDDATHAVPITSYDASYVTGSSQAIGTGILVAKNTKANSLITDITTAVTDILVDAGVGNKFTAGGIITAVAFYEGLTDLTSVA